MSTAVVAVVLSATSSLSAQEASLANLAAREAERRGAVSQPSRVFTNADIVTLPNRGPVPTPAPVLAPSPGPVKSIYDLRRERGEVELERAIQILAQEADDLDTQQRRYSSSCKGHSSSKLAFGSWLWIDNKSLPECLSLRSDIAVLTKGIRAGMEQALENARRADVYPGTARDLRRKYALDGPDLDR